MRWERFSIASARAGHLVGGVNVFGGGLPLYDTAHRILGGLGVSAGGFGHPTCAGRERDIAVGVVV